MKAVAIIPRCCAVYNMLLNEFLAVLSVRNSVSINKVLKANKLGNKNAANFEHFIPVFLVIVRFS